MSNTARRVTDAELRDAIAAAAADPSGVNGLPTTRDVEGYIEAVAGEPLSKDQIRTRCRRLERQGQVALHESTAFQGDSKVTTTLTIDLDGGDQTTLEGQYGDA